MNKPLKVVQCEISRICVFVHPGQLTEGKVHLVAFHDGDIEYFRHMIQLYESAQCVYDGPPTIKE